MVTHGNDPANPIYPIEKWLWTGLTKREYFAAMGMQGLIACLSSELTQSQLRKAQDQAGIPQGRNELMIAKCACDYADALIEELSK